jgi:hypothetical protein
MDKKRFLSTIAIGMTYGITWLFVVGAFHAAVDGAFFGDWTYQAIPGAFGAQAGAWMVLRHGGR